MADFGWNRSAISLAFFINMTVYALSLIVVGRAYDRYGPKWVIAISTVFLSAGFMLLAFIDSLSEFFISYGVLAAIGMGGTTVPLFAILISKWFNKYQGLAVSLGLTGSCVGQFILVPAFTMVVPVYGWRISYFSIGLVMLVVIIALALLVIKGDPESLGLKPYGYEEAEKITAAEERMAQAPVKGDLGLKEAIRTYSFWLFMLVNFVCGSGDFLVATHLIPFVTDHGISPTTGGNMLAWLGLMSLAGILIAGPLSDLIGIKIPFASTFLIRCLLFVMILHYQNTVSFYLLACFFGFTLLVGAPLTPILVGKMYGLSHVGFLTGIFVTIHHLGGGFWAYVGGIIFDHTGSYRMAFIISALMAMAAFISMMLIREERHQVEG